MSWAQHPPRGGSASLSIQNYLLNKSDVATKRLTERIDQIVEFVSPNTKAAEKRERVIDHVRKTIEETLPDTSVYSTGSFPLKAYLPTSDIDLTIIVDEDDENDGSVPWYSKLLTQLSKKASVDHSRESERKKKSRFNEEDDVYIRNVSFIASDVKLIKCVVDNISVDISANKLNGIAAVAFLAEANAKIGKNDLFLRSVLLIKAWCSQDASHTVVDEPILGSDRARLSSYALCILVLRLFNTKRGRFRIAHPFHTFALFFDEYAHFPWDDFAITVYGAVPLDEVAERKMKLLISESVPVSDRIPPMSTLTSLSNSAVLRKLAKQRSSERVLAYLKHVTDGFLVRKVNIVDPLDSSNNLGRSVSKSNFEKMKHALIHGRQITSNVIGAYFYAHTIAQKMSKKGRMKRSPSGEGLDGSVSVTQEAGQTRGSDSEQVLGNAQFRMASSLLDALFPQTVLRYGQGNGFRPDLLKQPFQAWVYRGPARSRRTPSSASHTRPRDGRATTSKPVVGSSVWSRNKHRDKSTARRDGPSTSSAYSSGSFRDRNADDDGGDDDSGSNVRRDRASSFHEGELRVLKALVWQSREHARRRAQILEKRRSMRRTQSESSTDSPPPSPKSIGGKILKSGKSDSPPSSPISPIIEVGKTAAQKAGLVSTAKNKHVPSSKTNEGETVRITETEKTETAVNKTPLISTSSSSSSLLPSSSTMCEGSANRSRAVDAASENRHSSKKGSDGTSQKQTTRRKTSKAKKKRTKGKEFDVTNERITAKTSRNDGRKDGGVVKTKSRPPVPKSTNVRRGWRNKMACCCRGQGKCGSVSSDDGGCMSRCFARVRSCVGRKKISRVAIKLAKKSRGVVKNRKPSSSSSVQRNMRPVLVLSLAVVFVVFTATYCTLSSDSELSRGLRAFLSSRKSRFANEDACGNNGYARGSFAGNGAYECLCFRGWQGERCEIPYFNEHPITFTTHSEGYATPVEGFMVRDFQLSQESSETTVLHHRVLHGSFDEGATGSTTVSQGRRRADEGRNEPHSYVSSLPIMRPGGGSSVKTYVRFAVDEEVYV